MQKIFQDAAEAEETLDRMHADLIERLSTYTPYG